MEKALEAVVRATNNTKDAILMALKTPKGEQTVYWVASRCVYVDGNGCTFGVRRVGEGALRNYFMYYSDGYVGNYLAGLFPVVTLKSGVISGDATEGYVFSTN